MASEAERNEYFDEELESLAQGPDADDLHAALEARMQADDRLESGVPADMRHDDIGFIQFSGITRPNLAEEPPTPAEHDVDLDLDPSMPVSFYEPGVADVDASMAPAGAEDGPRESDIILPLRPTTPSKPQTPDEDDPPSAAALKDLIAELSGGELALEDLEITENDDPGEDVGAVSKEEVDSPVAEDPEPEESTESLDTLDIFASALAQPPNVPPPRQEEPEETIPDESPDEFDAPPTPIPAEAMNSALKARMAPRLNEAEELMAALDAAPENAPPAEDSFGENELEETSWTPAAVSPSVLLDEPYDGVDDDPEPVEKTKNTYRLPTRDRGDVLSGRRSSRGGRKRRRAIRAVAILSTLGLGIVSFGALVYLFVLPMLDPPDDAFARAMNSWNAQNYLAASNEFALFARRSPENPNRAEAQFRAALAKQTAAQTHNRDERDKLNREALAMFESYIADNPVHRKVARAESLCGILLFELGDYEGAITRLRNARRQVSDPDAALASLRTLAAAYSKLGQVDDAESTYLQAAVLPGNYTRDVDYLALGDLFSRHAEMATDPGEREANQQKAAEYWTLTLSLASADPKAKKEVQAKLNMIDALRQPDNAEVAVTASSTEVVTGANEVTVVEIIDHDPVNEPPMPSPDPGVTESTDAAAEPDPMEEAAFLEGNS